MLRSETCCSTCAAKTTSARHDIVSCCVHHKKEEQSPQSPKRRVLNDSSHTPGFLLTDASRWADMADTTRRIHTPSRVMVEAPRPAPQQELRAVAHAVADRSLDFGRCAELALEVLRLRIVAYELVAFGSQRTVLVHTRPRSPLRSPSWRRYGTHRHHAMHSSFTIDLTGFST